MSVVPIKRHAQYERQQRYSAARTLSQAKRANCSEVLVIGIDDEGELLVKSYPNDPGNAFWLMEKAKRVLVP